MFGPVPLLAVGFRSIPKLLGLLLRFFPSRQTPGGPARHGTFTFGRRIPDEGLLLGVCFVGFLRLGKWTFEGRSGTYSLRWEGDLAGKVGAPFLA